MLQKTNILSPLRSDAESLNTVRPVAVKVVIMKVNAKGYTLCRTKRSDSIQCGNIINKLPLCVWLKTQNTTLATAIKGKYLITEHRLQIK
jgi:hypothetical protein